MTQFEPVGETAFRYEAKADLIYPLDSAGAEADRIAWLEQYLRDNGVCPGGYRIADRRSVLVRGPIHQIYYDGVCL